MASAQSQAGKSAPPSYKLVVAGSGGVGKSALTIQFVQGKFVKYYDPTIEDSYRKQITLDDENETVCFLEIIDTAGEDEYSALREHYMRNGEGFLLVYSITDAKSLEDVKLFYELIMRVKEAQRQTIDNTFPVVLVGNKCDLEDTGREISFEQGKELAEEWGAIFFETSAKTKQHVEKSFFELVKSIRSFRGAQEPEEKPLPGPKRRFCSIL